MYVCHAAVLKIIYEAFILVLQTVMSLGGKRELINIMLEAFYQPKSNSAGVYYLFQTSPQNVVQLHTYVYTYVHVHVHVLTYPMKLFIHINLDGSVHLFL